MKIQVENKKKYWTTTPVSYITVMITSYRESKDIYNIDKYIPVLTSKFSWNSLDSAYAVLTFYSIHHTYAFVHFYSPIKTYL